MQSFEQSMDQTRFLTLKGIIRTDCCRYLFSVEAIFLKMQCSEGLM